MIRTASSESINTPPKKVYLCLNDTGKGCFLEIILSEYHQHGCLHTVPAGAIIQQQQFTDVLLRPGNLQTLTLVTEVPAPLVLPAEDSLVDEEDGEGAAGDVSVVVAEAEKNEDTYQEPELDVIVEEEPQTEESRQAYIPVEIVKEPADVLSNIEDSASNVCLCPENTCCCKSLEEDDVGAVETASKATDNTSYKITNTNSVEARAKESGSDKRPITFSVQNDDIDDIAREIYNPDEREKKLRLLRLLIQEALPSDVSSKGRTHVKTIEIPANSENELKDVESIVIRIIVEK